MFLEPTTETEIFNIIKLFGNNSAHRVDVLDAYPLKVLANLISTPLTHIYSIVLSTGIFPERIKVGRACVMHKGGSVNNLSNYTAI